MSSLISTPSLLCAVSDCFTHAFDLPLITLIHSLVVILFAKEEWEDALGDQVSAVDAGEGPGNDRANSEVQRRERGLFAAGALPVVVPADDEASAPLKRPVVKTWVLPAQHVLRALGYIRPEAHP